MEKTRISLFDIFGQILPGGLQLMAILLLINNRIIYLSDILKSFEDSSTNQILIGIGASYILCVATHQLGYQWFKAVGIRLYKYSHEGYVSGHKSDHLVLVREFSPRNMAYLDEWMAKRAMAYNLSIGFLLVFITSLFKFFRFDFQVEWLPLAFLGLGASVLLLKRAVLFYDWYLRDLENAVEELHLVEKAKRFPLIGVNEGREIETPREQQK